MAIRLVAGQTINGVSYPAGAAVFGLDKDIEARVLQGGNATPLEFEMVAAPVYSGTALPTIGGVPVAGITLDAGTGNTVGSARITFAPPTDTIGAQRLLTPTDETYTLTIGQTRTILLSNTGATALVAHAVGVSSSTTYTGAAFVIGSAETDLVDALANDARLEWLADDVARVDVTLVQGPTTRTAILQVLGWVR